MPHRHLQYHVRSAGRGLGAQHHHVLEDVESVVGTHVPTPVLQARADSTSTSESSSSPSCSSAAQCEKPVSDSSFTIPVALGVVIPVVAAAILFFILHRRHQKKLREEDANDRHASMDFGMGEVAKNGEKKPDRHHQLSMDMNLTSPYLLPPELQASRESFHSLSKTIHENEDPYRPVSRGRGQSDAMSMRSTKKGDGASVYTASSNMGSKLHQEVTPTDFLANNPGPRSTSPYMPPPHQNSVGQNVQGHAGSNGPAPENPFASSEDALPFNPLPSENVPYPTEPPQAHMPTPANDIARKAQTPGPKPSIPAPQTAEIVDADTMSDGGNHHHPANQHSENLGNSLPDILRPARTSTLPPINTHESTFMDEESEYGEGFKVTPPSPGHDKDEHMRAQRYSMDVPPEEFANAGLGAPGFDAKRLSMGFRPLPPEAATDHDDPEVRANRIRSFYKEYFDDSKPAPAGQYYEDYDENYLGETPEFVMPFAQPVGRRAMTPPPRAPRFQGPPPRAMHGSMSGPRGPPPPRGMFPPSRAASAMSGASEGPRPYSSASNRVGPAKPKKMLPPPADLTTLPTPSKLRDDSFALMSTLDFAPPTSVKDRAAGRSESPFGERRPYSPAVPAFKPLVSAFDDLSPMPSPALLRKSGTFTSLDFAPPRKFRDPENMSDAGSIRSNKSGISATQLGAIRNGAYRVSRLPTDQVGTRDDLSTSLKPQWGMRG
ncbi:hypothetical protein F5884DRAFT_669173 [Xylogone sp. PMI_703]|nr:hypothetical protein F5884DRAFT_669173 [Xylogone sp. PMI_703]